MSFLGIDVGTQSLTGVVVDTDRQEVALAISVGYGEQLPQYESPQGYLYPDDSPLQHANPLMWVDALEMLFKQGCDAGYDWGQVTAMSCSGQQHGTVYLNAGHRDTAWQPGRSLADQVRPLLSRDTSPIWMDSSTGKQCTEIADAAGGDQRVVEISGSAPTERFAGPQIRKFFQEEPEAYEATARIHLVSSFFAFVLAARDAAIDLGDGAGMNLLDLSSGTWSPALMDATARGLRERLPEVAPCNHVVGNVAGYFVERYGFSPVAQVLVSSGDNPSSLIGMGASRPGTVVISLGTSDTLFVATDERRTDPQGLGHVFGNPAGGFLSLICFKNGSLTRDAVAKRFGMSWPDFSEAIQQTPPGNHDNLLLPYLFPEITPVIIRPEIKLFGSPEFINWNDPQAAVRATVEAQALSMRLHSQWIAVEPKSLLVTGGASENDGILQIFADVFQASLQRSELSDSAALGAALRAAHDCGNCDWDELFSTFSKPDAKVIDPDPNAADIYNRLEQEFAAHLKEFLASGSG